MHVYSSGKQGLVSKKRDQRKIDVSLQKIKLHLRINVNQQNATLINTPVGELNSKGENWRGGGGGGGGQEGGVWHMGGTERGGMGVICSERKVPERQGIRQNEWARSKKYEAYPFALRALSSRISPPPYGTCHDDGWSDRLEETNSLGRINVV